MFIESVQMTFWQAEAKKVLGSLRKFPDADPFLLPVDWKGLGLKDYPQIVKVPMDLTTVATKLSNQQYSSIEEFVTDFKLIISNCQMYNADKSAVYEMAARVDSEFERLMVNVWSAWKEEAKRILTQLRKNKNAVFFLDPVDWKALGLTDYLSIVKQPMDLSTVGDKLGKEMYGSPSEFFEDLNLIWTNCMVYNADGSDVHKMAMIMRAESERLEKELLGVSRATPRVSGVVKQVAKRKAAAVITSQDFDFEEGTSLENRPTEFPLEDDRREDVLRLGKRFAMLQADYLAGAIRFIHAKCPNAIRSAGADLVDVDIETVAKDPSCSISVNQLVKVMLFLQNNPE